MVDDAVEEVADRFLTTMGVIWEAALVRVEVIQHAGSVSVRILYLQDASVESPWRVP